MGNAPDCNYNLGRIRFDEAYTSWGADSNNGSENLIYSFADDATLIRGKHTFKFGGMYQKGSVQRLRPPVRRRLRELQLPRHRLGRRG